MSKDYIDSGDVFDDLVAPSGGVKSGLIYILAGLVVVAQTSADEGELFTGKVNGNWRLPAATHASNQAATRFDPAYWDATAKVITKTATGNTLVGCFTADKVSTVAEAEVKLWDRPPAQEVADPPANTAPTNSTPYGFSQAQAVALLAWVRDADTALKAAGVIK